MPSRKETTNDHRFLLHNARIWDHCLSSIAPPVSGEGARGRGPTAHRRPAKRHQTVCPPGDGGSARRRASASHGESVKVPHMLRTMIVEPAQVGLAGRAGTLYAPWRVGEAALGEGEHDGVRPGAARSGAGRSGIVTDGEQPWAALHLGLPRLGLTGDSFGAPGQTRRAHCAPRIVGDVTWTGPVLLDAVRFARRTTTHRLKVTLPGPMTIVDSLLDERYALTEEALAMRFAAIRKRGRSRRPAPMLSSSTSRLQHLPRQGAGLGHRGAGALHGRRDGTHGGAYLLRLRRARGGGLEDAEPDWGHYGVSRCSPLRAWTSSRWRPPPPASMFPFSSLAGKDVLLGVIDVGTEAVETPETVAERIRAGAALCDARASFRCTDCGLVPAVVRRRGQDCGRWPPAPRWSRSRLR